MNMKRYAVFAKKTQKAQREGDYTIWHFLNDTNDANEAFYWYYHAKHNNDDYDDVQIVESVYFEATKIIEA
jgi:hypothetical protein